MTESKRLISIIFAVLLSCLASVAQNSTMSPYSMFGVGVLNHREHATSAGMGHAGIALAPNDWLNISNPAAVSNLDTATFYFNFQLVGLKDRESTPHTHTSLLSGNIDGITLGCRATKWWGFVLGYAPYSSVGYSLEEERNIRGTSQTYEVVHSGSGGLQHAFINNAFSFFKKHISVGVSTGVMWGSFSKKESALFSNATNNDNNYVLYGEDIYNLKKYTCNNLFFEFGMQFDFNIGQNNFRFGGVYNNIRKMLSSYDHIVSNDYSSQLFFDDIIALKDEFHVPTSYGGGFAYTRKKLLVTADYRFNKWGEITNAKFSEPIVFCDNYSIGGGLQYSAGEAGDPFYRRMKYRLGYYYSPSNFKLRQKTVDEYGVTLGMTIPLGRHRNDLVIAYEYQQRGTESYGFIKESIHNIKIALNIRENWFLKSKFD